MRSTLIIIPTYNERENIEGICSAIFETLEHAHILVIDDGSPDGTAELVEARPEFGRSLHIVRREGKLGLGTAYLRGFQWALERDYERIFEMDADFSHDPKYLPAMLEATESADVAVGSRYVGGGGTEGWGLHRRLLSRGGSLYARTILGMKVRDLTAGFICYRREALEAIDLGAVDSNGYVFQIEMKYRAFLAGLTIREVPIVFPDRVAGESKMHAGIASEALIQVWKLRWRLGRRSS